MSDQVIDTSSRADSILSAVAAFPKVPFLLWETPVEHQPRLSEKLGIRLLVKRDDLTGLAFGGNKVRKLQFYFGKAVAAQADTVLITGAVQSNYVRVVAACAARLGMACHIQLENRVPNVDEIHQSSGNVLIDHLLGAIVHTYPVGEDEEGADAQLRQIAAELASKGQKPFVIPLGANNPPLGSLGYIGCALELLRQTPGCDHIVVPSGSGQTHAGLLFGLRSQGWKGRVLGICVRRAAQAQADRIQGHCARLGELLKVPNPVTRADIEVYDDVLSPGYGVMNDAVADAIRDCARLDGLLMEPVYTGRAMAGLIACCRDGRLPRGGSTVFIHTGGLPALFGYETELRQRIR